MVIISSYWYVLGALLAVGIWGMWYGVKTQKRQNLAKGFLKLGNLEGRHYDEFRAAMGDPTDVNKRIAQNTQKPVTVVTWSAGGFEIIIMFDDKNIFNQIISASRS